MEKRKIIIMTIISTVLSLAFILLSYYGITRYISLYTKSPERFIRDYSNLPKASKNRVVISLATTPDTVDRLKPVLNSILDQTVKVDQILLITSRYDINIPKYVNDIANVIPAGKDYGKGTKLIPTLLREKECNTIIIALDNNVIYGKDFIETIIEESEKNPDAMLVDSKGYAMLVKPIHFGCDVIDRDRENFDNLWFISKANKNKVVNYGENYRY